MKKEFDFIGFWAQKCRENMPECRRQALQLNDDQIRIANNFYARLGKTMGRKKVLEMRAESREG